LSFPVESVAEVSILLSVPDSLVYEVPSVLSVPVLSGVSFTWLELLSVLSEVGTFASVEVPEELLDEDVEELLEEPDPEASEAVSVSLTTFLLTTFLTQVLPFHLVPDGQERHLPFFRK